MPEFLEKKLKQRYGQHSPVVYKVLNKLGYMKGNKETAAGRRAEKKHQHDHPGRAAAALQHRYPSK